jgi:hypothetical protein
MRVLVVGDQHFRFELPYASAIADGRRGEWKAVKQAIHDAAESCDAVVLMGDNLNTRHNHSSVIREFVDFLKGFGNKPVHILVGNHERYGQNTALDFLKKLDIPNWHVYMDVTAGVQLGNVRATFIPYTTPAMLGVETKLEAESKLLALAGTGDVCFVHHAITGTKGTEFFNEIMLDKAKMSANFGYTFGGHVHKAEQIADNIRVVGNIFTHEVGEHSKSIFEWDSKLDAVAEIVLPVRGIYKTVVDESNLYTGFSRIPKNSIVKCYVTSRAVSLEVVREKLKEFDAGVIIEQYADERTKTHFESGALDLSTEGLLKMYAEAKKVDYTELLEGFELIK